MKHEAILEGDWLPRDPRVDAEFDVRVRWDEGEAEAQILNVSADGFRLRTMDPLQVGWEVTLETRQVQSGEGDHLLGVRARRGRRVRGAGGTLKSTALARRRMP